MSKDTPKTYVMYCELCSETIAMPTAKCDGCHARTNMSEAEIAQYKEYEKISKAIEQATWHINNIDGPISNIPIKTLMDIWYMNGKTLTEYCARQMEQLKE